MGYFTRALGIADEAGDAFGIANAACHAGVTLVRSGYPDDALKCFQLGEFTLKGFQPGKSKPAILLEALRLGGPSHGLAYCSDGP